MDKNERLKKTLQIFKTQKIISMDKLVALLQCSKKTTRRRLKQWSCFTSYNQNSRYYVLPNVPEFDEYGLWKYKRAFFSKHGNLKETIASLVNQSKAGLSAFEIGEIVSLPPHTFLSHFKDHKNIQRRKYKGLYIYFSTKPSLFSKQTKEREKLLQAKTGLPLPSDSDAIIILVTLIKHPDDTLKQLVRRVRRKGIKVSIEKCRNLLIYHDIQKKTTDINSSKV